MKKTVAFALAMLVLLCACADSNAFSGGERLSDSVERNTNAAETFNYADGAAEPPAAYNNYANVAADFSLKLLRNRFDESAGTAFVCAPANTMLTLSLLHNGASDDAKSELQLQFGGMSAEDLNLCGSYFQSRLEKVAQTDKDKTAENNNPLSGEHLSLSQNLFVNEGFDITTAFLQNNADYYGGTIIRSRFAEEGFPGKQRALLADYRANVSLEGETGSCMYAVTASSLADRWLTPRAVADGTFKGSSDQKTRFMISDEAYLHTDTAEGVVAYTAKNPLKFVAVMPKDNAGLGDYLRKLGVTELDALLNSMKAGDTVRAALPQFSIDGGTTAKSLRAPLEKGGLHTLFSNDAHWKAMDIADKLRLNNLYELPPSLTLSASGVLNTAEQADAQPMPGEKQQVTPKSKKELRFDKPFVFFFIDNESNIPVYAGVYQ